jgi:hypothetical protein
MKKPPKGIWDQIGFGVFTLIVMCGLVAIIELTPTTLNLWDFLVIGFVAWSVSPTLKK